MRALKVSSAIRPAPIALTRVEPCVCANKIHLPGLPRIDIRHNT